MFEPEILGADIVFCDQSLHELLLAQCEASDEYSCQAADDMQAMIDAQKAKLQAMKTRREDVSKRRAIPKSHEEAMQVI